MPPSLTLIRDYISDHTDALIKFCIWKEKFSWNERLGKPITVAEINAMNVARAGLVLEDEMLRQQLRNTPRFVLERDPELQLFRKAKP